MPAHTVVTVTEQKWNGIKNGELLSLAAAEFDAFLTADQNLGYQQNVEDLSLAVIVLVAYSNRISDLSPLLPNLEKALTNLVSKSYVLVRA